MGRERSTAVSEIATATCRVDRLAEEGAPLVAAALDATGAQDARVRAAWLVHGYTWLLVEPVLTAFWRDGALLDTRADRVRVAARADGGHELLFDAPPLPATGDRDHERTRLVAGLEAHLEHVVALPQLRPIGRRLRWLLAADMLAGAALHVGYPLLGREGVLREAEALCAVPGRLSVPLDPIPGGDPDDHPERWRASCCLAHRAGHELCATCPRRRPRG